MRTRVIPAQITTVEDKIAGNLSLTQIIILLSPVLFATLVYITLPPSMMFVWYKLSLTLVFAVFSILLSIRVKGKIIASWLIVLLKYNARPKYYIFNKNEIFERVTYSPQEEVPTQIELSKTTTEEKHLNPSIADLLKLHHIIDDKNFDIRYKTSRKGGLNVAFEKITK